MSPSGRSEIDATEGCGTPIDRPFNRAIDSKLRQRLNARRAAHQLRVRRPLKILDSTHVELDGATLVNFAGNDYLGLSHHPRLQPEAFANQINSAGASGSALISGYTVAHAAAEARIAEWKYTEAAVLLPSGYQANHAAIQTLAALADGHQNTVRFLIDKLSHASLIDAVRGTGCPFRIFPHNQLAKLTRLLLDAPAEQLQVVVTESIFSMDGDEVNLTSLATLRERFGFVLLLDEAHGSGVYGPGGSGLAAERGLSPAVDVSVCTFSKAAGLIGGAVCASKEFCEAVVNFGRAYVYSTAVPPLTAMQIHRSIELMKNEPHRQARVRHLAKHVRAELQQLQIPIPSGDSPIIPVIVGDTMRAVQLSERLRCQGIFIVPVRPPTVARNAARLRITFSSEHTGAQIDHLIHTVRDLLEP